MIGVTLMEREFVAANFCVGMYSVQTIIRTNASVPWGIKIFSEQETQIENNGVSKRVSGATDVLLWDVLCSTLRFDIR